MTQVFVEEARLASLILFLLPVAKNMEPWLSAVMSVALGGW